MKENIKFDHKKEKLADAIGLGLSTEEISDKFGTVLSQFINGDDEEHISKLAELIHQKLTYKEMVFATTMHMLDVFKKSVINKNLN
jgi:hypothetical protein